MSLGKTVGEVEQMPAGEFVEWQAFYQMWPFGEDIMDKRFEVLHATMRSGFENLAYVTSKSAGAKGVKKPQQTEVQPFFNRVGIGKPKKYYDEMSQEEIAKRMGGFRVAVQAKK